jgi:UDP:flavonoid glycosyltransferase YjiC (YdhE family)
MARASVVVHHGGSGTVLGALEVGCRHVAVPLFADQGDNAAMLERAGLGLAVVDRASGGPPSMRRPGPDDARRIRESLQLVLASDEMQVTSRDVAARMADLPELGDVPLT